MEEANPFDEFDETQEVNPFDEFDEPVQAEAPPPEEERAPPGVGNTFIDYATSTSPLRLIEKGYNYLAGDDSEVVSDITQGVVGGAVLNAPKNIVETAVAVGSYSPIIEAYKYLTSSEGPEFYEQGRDAAVGVVEEGLPEFMPQNTTQEVSALGGEIAAGIVVGNKVQAAMKAAGAAQPAIASIAEKAPKVVKYFSKLATSAVSQGVGTASTIDADSDTLMVGKNAIGKDAPFIPAFEGLDGEDESRAQQIVEQRLNIALDAMILAAPVDLIADGGKALFGTLYNSFVKPVHGAFSDKVKADVAFDTFEKELRLAIDPYDPYSQVADEYVQKTVDIIADDKNGQILFPNIKKSMDVEGPNKIDLDTATTVSRGLAEDASDESTKVKEFFNKKRKEVIDQGGVTQTDIVAQRPVRAAERAMQEGYEAYGAEEGINTARKRIQESGQSEVDAAEDLVRETTADLTNTQENYGKILAEDEGLGPRLKQRAEEPISAAAGERNAIVGDIVETTRQGNKALREGERFLWQNIPEDLPVDEASLNVALANANDYLDSSSKKALRDAGVDLDAALSDEFIEDAPIADFAKLQNTLRKPLNAAIERAKKSGVGYEELLELKNNITDVQPEWLGKRRGKIAPQAKAGKKALEQAVEKTKEVGGIARSGMPRRISDIDKQFGLDKVGADQAAYEEIEKGLRSRSSPMMKHYADVLARPEYGGKQGLIVDAALSNVAEDMADILRTDGVTALKPKDILKSLRPFRTTLGSNPKFAKELKRLDDFEAKLIQNSNNAKQLEELIKEYTAKADETKKKVYEVSLKEFFSKEGVPNPEGYESFKKVFVDPQATGKFDEGRLDDMISRMDPAAREGAVAAWFRYLKDQAFTSAPGQGSSRQLSTAKVSDILDEENKILMIGKKLLGEDDRVVDIMTELLDPSLDITVAKKASAIKSAESTVSENAAKKAITRMVLAIKGPLTRTGARMSVAAATILDMLKPNDVNRRIADAMMADRKAFLEMYDKFSAKKNRPTKEGLRTLFNWAVKMGIYNEGDKFEDWKKKVDETFQEAETEEVFGEQSNQ